VRVYRVQARRKDSQEVACGARKARHSVAAKRPETGRVQAELDVRECKRRWKNRVAHVRSGKNIGNKEGSGASACRGSKGIWKRESQRSADRATGQRECNCVGLRRHGKNEGGRDYNPRNQNILTHS